jgi:enoyl-CoA hydratase/carnithine racemase
MTMTTYENLLIERRLPAAIVTINRPDKQNAFTAAMLRAVDAAFADLDEDPEIRGIVLTGNDKVFSTGGDLKEGLAIGSVLDTRRWLEAFRCANRRVESITKPVVAAINGFCITGGLELALCCDIRIAGTGAQFGITSSRIGTVAGAGGPQRLARLVGPEWTKEMLFSGNFIDAQTALQIRLVSEVAAPEDVVKKALARIDAYAQRAPLSIAYSKMAVNNGLQMDLESALHYERQLTTTLFTTDDRKEGMAAFLEKRPPKFQGR